MSLAIMMSSAAVGIPLMPMEVDTVPSFIAPSERLLSSQWLSTGRSKSEAYSSTFLMIPAFLIGCPSSDTATIPASFISPISEMRSPSIPFVAAPMGYTRQLSASLAFLRIPLITAALSATGFVLGIGQIDV